MEVDFSTDTEPSVHLSLTKHDGTTFVSVFCGEADALVADGTLTSKTTTNEPINQNTRYILTAHSGSQLHNLLSGIDPGGGVGEYELRISTQACQGGALSPGNRIRFTINAGEAFRITYHYRDHIGTTFWTKTFTPDYNDPSRIDEADLTINLDSGSLTLYPTRTKESHFEPFGEPLGSSGNAVDLARYTDHERDATSGFNYMKGRFQLANLQVFNRPDPMRDWDWENPQSLNLYQYVRNNPISGFDPDGFHNGGAELPHERGILFAKVKKGELSQKAYEAYSRPLNKLGRSVGIGLTIATIGLGGVNLYSAWLTNRIAVIATTEQVIQGVFEAETGVEIPIGGPDEIVEMGVKSGKKIMSKVSDAIEDAPVVFGPFHRRESPTQTPEVANMIESSGELWGKAPRGSDFPTVQAYTGPLPKGMKGIEFTTTVKPNPGKPPTQAAWSDPKNGVIIEGDFAKIKIDVTKNTQK